jgi:hypothetical protein
VPYSMILLTGLSSVSVLGSVLRLDSRGWRYSLRCGIPQAQLRRMERRRSKLAALMTPLVRVVRGRSDAPPAHPSCVPEHSLRNWSVPGAARLIGSLGGLSGWPHR